MNPYALPAWLALLLAVLAALYTWRVLAHEAIAAPVRNRLPHPVVGWLQCPFCSGAWITAAWLLTSFAWRDTVAWQLVAATAAGAYLVGHVGSRLDP